MADNDYTSSDDEMDEEDDIPAKDEVEESLEKLLFGDDEGFQSALKSHGQHQGSTDLVLASDQEDGEGEDEDEQNMDDVADADVSLSILDV
jgi:U3 small nucleolar RNA-associated protein 18